MSVEAIGSVSQLTAGLAPGNSTAQTTAKNDFAAMLDGLSDLNQQMHRVEHDVQQVALGHTDNLHQVMIGMEQAKLKLDLVLQVRNKIMDAYQELMRMQV
jgi:flagellar hook-basal body complex protein FliE